MSYGWSPQELGHVWNWGSYTQVNTGHGIAFGFQTPQFSHSCHMWTHRAVPINVRPRILPSLIWDPQGLTLSLLPGTVLMSQFLDDLVIRCLTPMSTESTALTFNPHSWQYLLNHHTRRWGPFIHAKTHHRASTMVQLSCCL